LLGPRSRDSFGVELFGNPVLAESLCGEFENVPDDSGFGFVDPLLDVRPRAILVEDLDVVVAEASTAGHIPARA